TVDRVRDLIRRLCNDSLMIPGNTRANICRGRGALKQPGRHTDVFAPVWHVARWCRISAQSWQAIGQLS
ncbi:hypothetical protein KI387_002558, partial [Taxus chinensis]